MLHSLHRRRSSYASRSSGIPVLNPSSDQSIGLVFWAPIFGEGKGAIYDRSVYNIVVPKVAGSPIPGTYDGYHTIGGDGTAGFRTTSPNVPKGSNQPFTLCARVKFDTLSSSGYVMSFGRNVANGGGHFGIASVNTFRFAIAGQGVIDVGGFAIDTWYDVVATYDGTNMRLYRDGALIGGPTASTINNTAEEIDILGLLNLSSLRMRGAGHDFRIYNVGWTAEQAWEYTDTQTRWDLYWQPKPMSLVGLPAAVDARISDLHPVESGVTAAAQDANLHPIESGVVG